MKTRLTFLLFLLGISIVYSQVIFSNEITDSNPPAYNPYTNAQYFDPNITVSGIVRGSNITPAPAAHSINMYAAQNWSVNFHADDYFEFVLTPNAGYEIDFVNFIYDGKTVNFYDTPPNNIIIKSSLDGYVSTIGNPTLNGTSTIDLTASEYQNITSAITFRVYAWGGAAAGIFGIERFEFNGAVNAIPCFGATTTTWDGGAWDNGMPDINTIAIIDGNFNTSAGGDQISFSACNLTINTGYTLTIFDGDYVEVENDLTNNGTIVVSPTAAVVQNIDEGSVTNSGSITIEKETAPLMNWYEYTYWSSPVANETVGIALTNSDADRRFYFNGENFLDAMAENNNNNTQVAGQDDIDDNADDWVWVSGATTMTPGVGYAATHSETAFVGPPMSNPPYQFKYIFSGTFNNGVITVPIYRNDSETNDTNWNLVGNPYPSAIDADLFLAANTNIDTNINHAGATDGAIFLWSQNTAPSTTANGNEASNFAISDYAVINAIGETAGGDGVTPNRYIPSGQAFFVSYSDAAIPDNVNGNIKQGTVTFNNSMRVTTNNDQFFRTAGNKKNENLNKLWIDLTSDNGVFNQTLIAYANNATDGFDGMAYDTPRNLSTNAAALVYSIIDGHPKKFAIQGKNSNSANEDEIIKLGFYSSIDVPTIFTLQIPQLQGDFLTNSPVVLIDKLLNITHALKESPYNFTSNVGEFNDRFEIIFNNAALSNDVFTVTNKDLAIIEHTNGNLQFKLNSSSYIIKNIKLIDLLGRTVYSFKTNKNDATYQTPALSKAPFIAKITLDNNQIITKKGIKKY